MANIAAAQTGNWSATSSWVGGILPGSGDIAFSNNFVITVDGSFTVQAISNAAGSGITVGGTFSFINGTNLSCTAANGILQGNTTTSCVTTGSLASGATATCTANCTNTATLASAIPVTHSGSGTLTLVGNFVSGGSSGSSINCTGSSLSVLSLTGNVTAVGGVGNASNHGVQNSGTGTVNITGTVYGGSTSGPSYGVYNTSSGSINVTGTVNGGSSAASYGAYNTAAGSITITGTVNGGGTLIGLPYGAVNNSTGTLTVNGSCISNAVPAIGPGSTNLQNTRLSGPFLLGSSGVTPVVALAWRWAPVQIPTYMEVLTSSGATKRNLYTSDNIPSSNYPVIANVRSGVTYGPNLENTGTLAVPSSNSVALGVAVDNTVGTAILTAANVRAAVGLASANMDTQFSNIPSNVWVALTSALTTVGSIGKLLVDNINATVGSRLASSSYTAPLDASGTRSAVGLASANLDTQLAAIPTASQNASAVRTNLTPELARIQNCSTVDTTAQTIQNAVSS